MQRTLALILAGGESPALNVLTAKRSEAAIPFAGKYRIIDFTLSNCVNSGIYNVGVLTQYRPRSLHEHIGVGKPWDLDRRIGGVRVLHPYLTREGGDWQRGPADAIRANLDFIAEQPVDNVLVLAGDHIYLMDYRPMLQIHQERDADVTVAVHSVSQHEVYRYGIVSVDSDGTVGRFDEKPRRSHSSLASMGIYAFRKSFLMETMAKGKERDIGRNLMPRLVRETQVNAYRFQGYWADVGTVQAYYEANMALLVETPALDMYDPEWIIHTRSEERPAAEIGATARAEGNLLCDGCRIYGNVTRSIVAPGVVIAEGATVRDSILMTDTIVETGALVDRCILDKNTTVGVNASLGEGDDNTPNEAAPDQLNTGLTLVGRGTHIPAGVRIGRNVVIRPNVAETAFGVDKIVPSGRTVE
ncbi:MAG: glucose-1-phosphate adenylyltransferase [Chloroflexi bacterium AL-W]|nr:glucose-1-phosphate adenylyltransferase [Chloroflexi bacterium AL-N1]NOK68905.1 glucose-1-phosphate adenylyltransferase [Chloroflexi bacterium AL-N10]NOK76888.1 glucose-1-phosphate adenylyltransferase [Chloroflexi bacterium AL-N5]NOK82724.1 glucose-1-phosphate adenylyltransferase [Chloroflexi bacterium AL-W]NOK90745.1 glucose-1-phosphate adenylyltransferase [Chloroflexi bacterium AL-N15]